MTDTAKPHTAHRANGARFPHSSTLSPAQCLKGGAMPETTISQPSEKLHLTDLLASVVASLLNETIGSEECAQLLRCTPAQVEELARAGEIPGLKLGRSWLFVRADLLSFLADKARDEAQQRRAKRQSMTRTPAVKPRRRQPPVLPTQGFRQDTPLSKE